MYAPSVYNLTFFPWLQNKLLALSDYALVIGADNNAVFHLQKDRSTQTFSIPQQASIALNNFTNDLGLSDVWRLQNTSKGYTCFSSYHKTFSRIDHILCSHKITSAFTQIQILPALLSDHNFLQVNLEILPRISKSPRWQFNTSLLQNADYISQMKTGLEEFISFNNGSVDDPAIIWQVIKGFIRDHTTSFSVHL